MTPIETIGFATVLVPTGVFLTIAAAGWLVLPLGIVGGWCHERATVGG